MAMNLVTEYYGPSQLSLWPYANTGSALAAGDMISLASGTSGYVGVVKGDIAATTGTGTVQVRGLVNATKASGEAFTVGQAVFFDGTSITGTSTTTSTRAGRIAVAAASAAVTCVLDLNA